MSDEQTHIGEMLGISDKDAVAVIKDVATAVRAHPRISDVVNEVTAKYDKNALLAGMLLAKTFEVNEDIQFVEMRLAESKKRTYHAFELVDDGEASYGEGSDDRTLPE